MLGRLLVADVRPRGLWLARPRMGWSAGEVPKSTIDLLQTFAAQSVLAIQNAHLFNEIRVVTQIHA